MRLGRFFGFLFTVILHPFYPLKAWRAKREFYYNIDHPFVVEQATTPKLGFQFSNKSNVMYYAEDIIFDEVDGGQIIQNVSNLHYGVPPASTVFWNNFVFVGNYDDYKGEKIGVHVTSSTGEVTSTTFVIT